MAQIKASVHLLNKNIQANRVRILKNGKSIHNNLQASKIDTKNLLLVPGTQIRFYARESKEKKKESKSKDAYSDLNEEWERQKNKIEEDMAEKEVKEPGRFARFWDTMTGGKEEFKRRKQESAAFKAAKEKLETDRAARVGSHGGYARPNTRAKEDQDIVDDSFEDKWKSFKHSGARMSDRTIFERFFITDWMIHRDNLLGTDFTNMDFWWNGNSSNQLTHYQERSDAVIDLHKQRWGINPAKSVRNLMRKAEEKRDELKRKNATTNPLIDTEQWQDKPFWMRSALVLDTVYPVLSKQAFNLYNLKEARKEADDLRFIWEKQEKYVEELKFTRDLKSMFVKNPLPEERNEVVDIPLNRYISPEQSREIEKHLIPAKATDRFEAAIDTLKSGKPVPYGAALDINKGGDRYNLPVHDPGLEKAMAKFDEKLRKQTEFDPNNYDTEEEREKARKHFEGMAELRKFVQERQVFLERKHLEEFEAREGISLETVQTFTKEEAEYEVDLALADIFQYSLEKPPPKSWQQIQAEQKRAKRETAKTEGGAEKPASGEGAEKPAEQQAAPGTDATGATGPAAGETQQASMGSQPIDTTPDEDDPAAKLKAEAKRRKEAAKKAAAAKPKPMTKDVLKLFPDAEEQANRLKIEEKEEEADEEAEDAWTEELFDAAWNETSKFSERDKEMRRILAQGVEIDVERLRREFTLPTQSREPETVIDRMWQKWIDQWYDVEYSDPEQTFKDLQQFALKPALFDLVVIKKFIEDQKSQNYGILRPVYASKIDAMLKFRDQVRMLMDERVYMIPRKILIYNQQQILQQEEDKLKPNKDGLSTDEALELMNLLEMATAGEAIKSRAFGYGNKSGVLYEWNKPMDKLEDRFVFSAYADRIAHRNQKLIGSELVRTNNGIAAPENFGHDHFPNPYEYEWENPQGLSEPDEAHIVNPHVAEKDKDILFGSYTEHLIEDLNKLSNSNSLFDMVFSSFYKKMQKEVEELSINIRERERIDDNKDESRYFFKMLEHFRPGYNHSGHAWEQGRRMPIFRSKMEEDEVEAFTMRGKIDTRAFPGNASREFTIQLTKPVYDQEFFDTMFGQDDKEVIAEYVNKLTSSDKPHLFDYVTTPENVYYDYHHRVKLEVDPKLGQPNNEYQDPEPAQYNAEFLKNSTPEEIQRKIDAYRKKVDDQEEELYSPRKTTDNYKLQMTFARMPIIPINRLMWQSDFKHNMKDLFESPNMSPDQIVELLHYEEMQRRWNKALANNTEPVEIPLPYSRERRRQALLLTQPNLKFADEMVYSHSVFSSTRTNHFMNESIIGPIDKIIYQPLRDMREKIRMGLVKESEAILLEAERKALKMTPHEYYVERKSKAQKELELARETSEKMTAEEEERWRLQLQQKFDSFAEEQSKEQKMQLAEEKKTEVELIRAKIRQFHEASTKSEEEDEKRALREQELAEKTTPKPINLLKREPKVVEKGVPEPEAVSDPILRSDDTQILIQIKREEEPLHEKLPEQEEDTGMKVSSEGDGRTELAEDKEDARRAEEDAARAAADRPQEARSEFSFSSGPRGPASDAPLNKEALDDAAKADSDAQPQARAEIRTEAPETRAQETEAEKPQQRVETREESVDEAEARARAEEAQQAARLAAEREERRREQEARRREEEKIDPRDREDHERVDVAERSDETDLMRNAEARTKYEDRKKSSGKESPEEKQEKKEEETSSMMSVFREFFKDDGTKSVATIEAEKMLAEHQKQIDENTDMRSLMRSNRQQAGKQGAFGISLRSSPEGGVGKVKEAAATAFQEDIRKRIHNFDLRIFAKTFTPIAFNALSAFVKGDMASMSQLASKEFFKNLNHDWKKLRAIGIESQCNVIQKGKPKLVAVMPSRVEEGVEIPPMMTFSIRIRFHYWVTYRGKTVAGGQDFLQTGRCLVTASLNKDNQFVIMEMDVQNKRLSAANEIFLSELQRIKDEREAAGMKAAEAATAEAERKQAEEAAKAQSQSQNAK